MKMSCCEADVPNEEMARLHDCAVINPDFIPPVPVEEMEIPTPPPLPFDWTVVAQGAMEILVSLADTLNAVAYHQEEINQALVELNENLTWLRNCLDPLHVRLET